MEGLKFNRLTIVNYSLTDKWRQRNWNCICDCGNLIIASTANLKSSNTKSCGCLQKEKAAISGANSATTHGLSKTKDGKKTRLFRIWMGIKTRCYNPNVKEYKNYGGRGITMCDEWKNDFKSFHDWAIAKGYSELLTIDRIENNKDYYPENCKWSTDKDQTRNRRSSRFLELNGESKVMSEWAELYGLTDQCLFQRLKKGWSVEKAITTRLRLKK